MCNDKLWQFVWPQLNATLTPKAITFGCHHNMDMMAQDITQALDLEPANLVAFSMGGYIAMRYAINNPAAINKLVLIGATGRNLTEQEQQKRVKILSYAKSNHYSGINNQRIKQFVHPNNNKSIVTDVIKQMDQDLGKEYLIAQLEATANRVSLFDQLHQLPCEVLLIGAEQDQLIPSEQMAFLAKHFNHATLKTIPNCGHMAPLEAPLQVADWINEFFA